MEECLRRVTKTLTRFVAKPIATGSAEGVGAAQNPPQFLQPGDTVELTIEKIGVLAWL